MLTTDSDLEIHHDSDVSGPAVRTHKVQDNIMDFEFLTLQSRFAYVVGEWGYLSPKIQLEAASLMLRYHWNPCKALRTVLGHSQRHMAELLGIQLPTYLAMEHGDFQPCRWTSPYRILGTGVDG